MPAEVPRQISEAPPLPADDPRLHAVPRDPSAVRDRGVPAPSGPTAPGLPKRQSAQPISDVAGGLQHVPREEERDNGGVEEFTGPPRPIPFPARTGREGREPRLRPSPDPLQPEELRLHMRRLEQQSAGTPPRWLLFGLPAAAILIAVGSLYWSLGLRNQIATQQSVIETLYRQKQQASNDLNAPSLDDEETGSRALPATPGAAPIPIPAKTESGHSTHGGAQQIPTQPEGMQEHAAHPIWRLPKAAAAEKPAAPAPIANVLASGRSLVARVKTALQLSPETAEPASPFLQTSQAAPLPAGAFDASGPMPSAKAAANSAAEGASATSVKPSVSHAAAASAAPSAPKKIAISEGVMAGSRISGAAPLYPAVARAANVQGTVEVAATISQAGTVENLRVLSGPTLLRQAALNAVKTWRYRPYLLDGKPVNVSTTIRVIFNLEH